MEERSLIYNPEYKGVRLDVYANDENNTRYDVEMQVAEQQLGKRIRYYHSQMDMELLESGHKYKELPASYVIFICDFDPFKRKRFCYTFESRCIEEMDISLEDESVIIILSTKGENVEAVPKELKDFLSFIKEDNPENNSESDDEYVHQLQKTIRNVKENKSMERGYMAWVDIRDEIRDEIKDEIRDEVRDEIKEEIWDEVKDKTRKMVLDILCEMGTIPKEIHETIITESNKEKLQNMVIIAARSSSLSDFQEKITKL